MSLVAQFSQNLKRARLKRALSQTQLADRASISVSYISMLERGQRSPPLQMLEQIANALSVPPVALLKAA